ncbi:MAG: nucleotidyltransferase domain-containing protein [Nanoarchaeota archaeon]|nr:nucleotidyltransferase domain-containing protein [Nanoarchaeota archaeon]
MNVYFYKQKLLRELIGKKKYKVIKMFLDNPSSKFSEKEIVQKTKVSRLTVRRWLSQLEKSGFIVSQILGRVRYYSLNIDSYEVRQFKVYYNSTSDIIMDLINKLRNTRTTKMILFGSFARGDDRTDSDIDVLIVTSEPKEKIWKIGEQLSKKYNKKLSLIVKSPEEYVLLAKKDNTLYRKAISEGIAYEF